MTEQIPGFAGRRLFGAIRDPLLQPFMHQLHLEIAALGAEDLAVFVAIAQHQRRIDAHQRHAELRHAVEEIGGFARGAGEPRQEALHMLRLAVRRERQQHRFIAELFHQPNEIRHHFGVVIAGERILNNQHVFFALLGVQPFQLFQRQRGRPVA
ncbi:Uncharacterised protein [Acinetobacter baumannii]|nr:Uncharacterised protein [Acinetobacter baumannii]